MRLASRLARSSLAGSAANINRIETAQGMFQSYFREVTVANNTSDSREQHWVKTRNLTIVVLILWFIFAILIPWNASALNAYNFLGFPLGYYMCVQGSLIAFVLMIWIQNWRQDAIDDEFGVGD
jgi:putative solute:sodium symporter small subunit